MNKVIIVIASIVTLLGLTYWWIQNNKSTGKIAMVNTEPTNTQSSVVKLINPQEFDQLAQNLNIFILDVHTPEQTHIPRTDAFIDYTKIRENQSQLPDEKDTPIIVYCRSGSMSAQASQDLVELGYSQVYDLEGGTNAYKQSGTQSVTISPDTQPLGTVIYGDEPETEFTLTNYTSKLLNVTRLSTSCGCTQAFMDSKTIQPFNTVPIKVTFDPAVHKDDTDVGELTRTVYVETDNQNYKKIEVTITANVIKEN